jgi:hypothetical protein
VYLLHRVRLSFRTWVRCTNYAVRTLTLGLAGTSRHLQLEVGILHGSCKDSPSRTSTSQVDNHQDLPFQRFSEPARAAPHNRNATPSLRHTPTDSAGEVLALQSEVSSMHRSISTPPKRETHGAIYIVKVSYRQTAVM